MGSFTLGFNGDEKKGAHTRWCMNPYVFDNSYFQELLLKDQSKYTHQEADMKLVQNASLKNWVEAYAQDQDLFFLNYAKAHVKLSEIGWENQLMSEFEPEKVTDGGYMESSRVALVMKQLRLGYTAYMTNQSAQEIYELEEEAKEQAK